MTNYEYYKDWFDDHAPEITIAHERVGVNKETGAPELCSALEHCHNCKFGEYDRCMPTHMSEWLKEKYEELEENVDWTTITVGTPIDVITHVKKNRYFKCYMADLDMVKWYEFRCDPVTNVLHKHVCGALSKDVLLYKPKNPIGWWTDAPKDTLIKVREGAKGEFVKRHFHSYVIEPNGNIRINYYSDGRSSKTATDDLDFSWRLLNDCCLYDPKEDN